MFDRPVAQLAVGALLGSVLGFIGLEFGLVGALGAIVAVMAYAWVKARYDGVYARLGAVLGWAIGFVIVKAVLGGWLWGEERSAQRRLDAIEKVLLGDPVFAALKERDAEGYKRTRDSLNATTKLPLADIAGLQREARREIGFALSFDDRLKSAGDDAVIAYAEALADAADELGKNDGSVCVRYLYSPIEREPDYTKILSAAQRQADTEAMVAVIRTTGEGTSPSRYDNKVSSASVPVLDELRTKYGDDWQVMNAPYKKDTDPGLLCRVTASLYRGLAALPAADAGMVLRYRLRRHG